MPVLTVRYEIRPEAREELAEGVARLIAALEDAGAADVRYVLGIEPDGITVTGLVAFEGAANPLMSIPAARDLQRDIASWAAGDPPMPTPLTVLGTYGLDAAS